ncbi:DUF2508 family protein [Brevibacillus daliensis]|uniref:DUF2508 family protein n=1 Tax=Brevibacillus daliensis TaxID=2892995 RepID=UPI001E5FFE43|nr:DUF2508 family protein [Brevibacillus daliensis]
MNFFKKKQPQLASQIGQGETLLKDVEQALHTWQNAQRFTDLSVRKEEVDHAIFYLQVTEKRYTYLLGKVRKRRIKKEA